MNHSNPEAPFLTTFYKPFNKDVYYISEFLEDYQELAEFLWDKLQKDLSINTEHGYCFALMVNANKDFLNLYCLLPIKTSITYENIIPDNDFNYMCNLNKLFEVNKEIEVDIEFVSKKIKIRIPITQYVFKQTLVRPIKFPEDFFLKSLTLLTQQLSQQIMLGGNDIKNSNWANIKALTINYLKKNGKRP